MRCATTTPTQCKRRAAPDSVYCPECREARQAPIQPADLRGIRFVPEPMAADPKSKPEKESEALAASTGIECPHGFDVCPRCDGGAA